MVHEKGAPATKEVQSRDGLTPPFYNARERLFRKLPSVNAAKVRHTEEDVLAIAAVHVARPCTH